jgi:hypothetical protein
MPVSGVRIVEHAWAAGEVGRDIRDGRDVAAARLP